MAKKEPISNSVYVDILHKDTIRTLKVDCTYAREWSPLDAEWWYVKGSLDIVDISIKHNDEWYSLQWLIECYDIIDQIKDIVLDEIK